MKTDSHEPKWFGFQHEEARRPFYEEGVLIGDLTILGVQPMANAANRRAVREHGAGRIGARTIIGFHCVLYAGTFIGPDCRVGDHAVIREDCRIGARCVVGTNVDIQYGAMIGEDVRILNGTHIAGGTVIGDGSFIGPGVYTANDRRIDLDDYQDRDTRAAPVIGKKVFVGVGAIILPNVTIGDGATIAAGAVVTRNVNAGETVYGMPAMTVEERGALRQFEGGRMMIGGR